MSTWAIVVAAGSGARFGDRKQFQPLAGRRVVDWAVSEARRHADGVVLVVPADGIDGSPGIDEVDVDREVGGNDAVGGRAIVDADVVVPGGATRSDSVRCGLRAVPDDAEVIVVHDGARPVPVPEVWERVLHAVTAGADAAVPAVPVSDTLREVGGAAVDRARFVAVQTPQAFRAEVLRAAHEAGGEATDDASLVEAAGGRVVLVDGDPANLKITTPVDLALAEQLCR